MGKASRWIRGLLGLKKGKENVDNNSNSGEKREKKRWSFAKSGKESGRLNQIPAIDSSWSEKEQSKHAIAVAAATAAAADAAVAAAQAAVAVVRLTSQGRGALFNGSRERWAALKIQSVFRGFLARKALRALRGLVKLQAHVRGYLVRKRAAATLYSMEALIRAQAGLRSQRARRRMINDYRPHPEMRARKSIERIDESRSEYHSRRLTSSYDPSLNAFDESPKIVEIDTYGPKSRSRRMSSCTSLYNNDDKYYYQAMILSPYHDYDWGFVQDDYKYATAQNTPRFGYLGRANAPVPPAKSVCGDGLCSPYSICPSYMANTQSFNAKLRSQSAPKQRPESGPKKRLSLNEIMASRTSFTAARMQRSCSHVQDDFEY
ncbi:hypothetical protein ACS0TY_012598 [Phlomoides rotata]